MRNPRRYAPPADLPEEVEEAKCEADVTFKIEEPKVSGVTNGYSFCGVPGVELTLSGGGKTFSGTSDSKGFVTLKKIPCGAYTIALKQDEFKIHNYTSLAFTVNANKKSGREKTIQIRRQLLTVEMFRLPTYYWESARRQNPMKTPDASITTDTYGHHWVQIYASEADAKRERAQSSYGWWPKNGVGAWGTVAGVPGALNGYPTYSTDPDRDPDEGVYKRGDKKLEETFFPFVTDGKTAAKYKKDLIDKAKGFSKNVSSEWAWRTNSGGWHCKSFQVYLMEEAKLWKQLDYSLGGYRWTSST